ncbi:MAG: SDR family NAD(P)-dependent oxidoreductase [Muribaculaceae bacterium]|nr:SDR family NAD(P)-dependent oxidoreductase [Muribaculaceae bacterium]
MKRIVIIGASSGLGYRIAEEFAMKGWKVGIAARRETPLKTLQERFPDNITYLTIDITSNDAVSRFMSLIKMTGGMDILIHASGIGRQNPELDIDNEINTVNTNITGFIRIVDTAYQYFKGSSSQRQEGHIAVISSVAGTMGIGIAASYCATKRFQYTYLTALEQLANIERTNISFTDIRPGFIDTPLLAGEKNYPMMMSIDYAVPRIIRAILQKKRIAIIDWRWRILVSLWRLIPRCLWKHLPIKTG